MKKLKVFIVFLILGFTALSFINNAESGRQTVISQDKLSTCVFTATSAMNDVSCEPECYLAIPGLNNIPVFISLKDFNKFIYYFLTENHKIEQESHSYIFFSETLIASISLSKLQRLNI